MKDSPRDKHEEDEDHSSTYRPTPKLGEGPVHDSVALPSRTATWDLRYAAEQPERMSGRIEHGDPTNRYLLRSCLNVGGCGEIWEALQVSLNRIVAVKRVHYSSKKDMAARERELEWLRWQFRQEALITARLDHPNILPVYDLGVDPSGAPVLAMKLVRGTPWVTLIRRDRESLAWDDFLDRHISILVDVCKAVAFAHSRDVIHRDLKPNQVMVGEFGEVLLMDWGLALYVGEPVDEATQSLLDIDLPTPLTAISPAGTPSMMAPEQTEDTADNITRATDVYLLGGTLYYILTGTYPHDRETSDDSMAAARHGIIEPPDLRAPRAEIPTDLKSLVLQALASSPEHRTDSVESFAHRLREFLRNAHNRREANRLVARAAEQLDHLVEERDPQLPNPVSQLRADTRREAIPRVYEQLNEILTTLDRAKGSWMHHPGIPDNELRAITAYADAALREKDYTLARVMCARLGNEVVAKNLAKRIDKQQRADLRQVRNRRVMLATTGSLAALLSLVVLVYAIRTQDLNVALEAERDIANERLVSLQAAERVASSQREIAEQSRDEAERLREEAVLQQYYSAIGYASSSLEQLRGELTRHLLLENTPGVHRGWEWGFLLGSLHPEAAMLQNPDQMFHAEFTPDGSRVATGDLRHVAMFDVSTGRMLWKRETNGTVVWGIQFNHDGSRLAAASFDRTISIVDTETGEILQRLAGNERVVRDAAFSPDGRTVATGGADNILRIYDVETGELLHSVADHTVDIYTVRYSHGGDLMVTASLDRTAALRDGTTGERIRTFEPHDGTVLSAVFSPDDSLVLTSDTSGRFRLFDVETGELVFVREMPEEYLHDAIFSPDGSMIITAADNGKVRIWNLADEREVGAMLVDDPAWKVRINPAGDMLVTTSRRSVRLIPMERALNSGDLTTEEVVDAPPISEVVDRVKIYGTTESRQPNWQRRDMIWDTDRGYQIRQGIDSLVGVEQRFSFLSPDHTMRAIVDRETAESRIVDVESGDVLFEPQMETRTITYDFDPNHPRVALMGTHDSVQIVSTETWETLLTVNLLELVPPDQSTRLPLNAIAFSPDSELLAIAGLFHGVALVDASTGELKHHLNTRPGLATCLDFSPDGRFIAVGGSNDEGAIYVVETGEEHASLIGHRRTIYQVLFNSKGTRLVSMAGDGAVKVWDAGSGQELATIFESRQLQNQPLGIGISADDLTIYVATRWGQFLSFDAVPWEPAFYEDIPGEDFEARFELWKRRTRLNESVSAEDLGVLQPPVDTASP